MPISSTNTKEITSLLPIFFLPFARQLPKAWSYNAKKYISTCYIPWDYKMGEEQPFSSQNLSLTSREESLPSRSSLSRFHDLFMNFSRTRRTAATKIRGPTPP